MKKWFTVLALAAVSAAAVAAGPDAQSAAAAAEAQTSQILGELRSHKAQYQANPAALQNYMNTNVAANFALDDMAAVALGRHLQEVQAAGKFTAFKTAFRELLIRIYSKSWQNYTNAQIKVIGTPVLKTTKSGKVRAEVRTVITNNGQSSNAMFVMQWDGGAWRILDAAFSNISILTSYRNTFDTELQKNGIDGLLAKMQTME